MRALAVCFLLALGGDEFGRAMSHYRAGRFDDAYRGFLEVSIAEGDDALYADNAACGRVNLRTTAHRH